MTSPDTTTAETTTAVRSDRRVVARGLFAGTTPVANEALYAVVHRGSAGRTRSELHLDRGARADMNTFFGRFPASYWQRWTTATAVTITVRVEASARARVVVMASDIGGHQRIVDAVDVHGTETVSLTAPLAAFADGGALWPAFEAVDGTALIAGVEWSVETTAAPRPISIAICTHNRVPQCAETVAALASDPVALADVESVWVVDQGDSPVEGHPLFERVRPELGDKLHYLRQANLGGAGGFSRGLYEAAQRSPHGDVILMDDDILCEPETVLRLGAFASMTATTSIVGAQMLFLHNPTYLLASAEKVDLVTLRRGVTDDKFVQQNKNMLKKIPDRRVEATYNGWWTCLIPAEVLARVGMPLPLFFQWDDVEYGLRAARAGVPTITLPGAGVWHADFYWKDVDGFGHYFATRNGLITAALQPGFAPDAVAKEMGRAITQSIVSMQYGLAHTQLRALEDFLSGPSILDDGGAAALRDINAERRRFADTVVVPMTSVPTSVPIRRAAPPPKPGWENAVLAKRALAHARGRLIGGPVAISYEDAKWWHVGQFDHVFVTDASQHGCRERRHQRDLAREMSERLVRITLRFRREAPAVADDYRSAMPQLTSVENWARLYGI
ncbi:glycosyltransferase [Williamsia phyllosphaerae]|uniref:Glycosyl transferase n=1 Tax=Williamsia phyllosphaerae TaxID=885042 RepID=A0ABQ1U927_9NOCA|nr:glycosyltransferase [Williamsia phyllosphaerae]GGF13628.1 glycosyl transferase [Williamsia phyllosphaerae]